MQNQFFFSKIDAFLLSYVCMQHCALLSSGQRAFGPQVHICSTRMKRCNVCDRLTEFKPLCQSDHRLNLLFYATEYLAALWWWHMKDQPACLFFRTNRTRVFSLFFLLLLSSLQFSVSFVVVVVVVVECQIRLIRALMAHIRNKCSGNRSMVMFVPTACAYLYPSFCIPFSFKKISRNQNKCVPLDHTFSAYVCRTFNKTIYRCP